MKKTDINDILRAYTEGTKDLKETNDALAKAEAGFTLAPGQNELTEADLRATTVGHYPEQATGYGLLDTGTGSMEKVHVAGGKLDYPVNEVQQDGATNMPAFVHICGKCYEVFGDKLGNVREA